MAHLRITKKGEDLLAKTSIHTVEFHKFLLKFAFMTDEEFAEWETLPTKEARKEYMKNLPLPERKK